MDRQALHQPISTAEREDYVQRIEFAQNELQSPRNLSEGCGWWNDYLIDSLSYCSQMLCGVKPYQWKAVE